MKKITQLRGKLLLTAGYLGVLLILRRLDVQCIFLSWFHIPCPGCGMSRAFAAALRFDFLEAFAYHPMFWSMPILYLYYLIDGGVFRSKKINTAILVSIAVGFVVQWVMKIVNYCWLPRKIVLHFYYLLFTYGNIFKEDFLCIAEIAAAK